MIGRYRKYYSKPMFAERLICQSDENFLKQLYLKRLYKALIASGLFFLFVFVLLFLFFVIGILQGPGILVRGNLA